MSGPPAAGTALRLAVLGAGEVTGAVERVEEVRPMGGLPGMVWRVTVRLPDGAAAEAIVTGDAPPAFLDPRYRLAGGVPRTLAEEPRGTARDPMSARDTARAAATRLKELHASGKPLVLPTVWDAWSARTAVGVGFSALTIGSHPLAEALGSEDGEKLGLEEVFRAVARIIGSVDVPVSVDLESGYGHPPQDLVDGLISAGAAGLNIEDTVHGEGGRLRDAAEHADYVAGLRAAADAAGVPLVVNGRTDLFKRADDRAAVLDEAIARLRGLVEAGADTVYPVRIQDDDALISAVVGAIAVPVNCTAHPVKHSLDRFARLGVGRITFGPLLQAALTDHSREIEARWRPGG